MLYSFTVGLCWALKKNVLELIIELAFCISRSCELIRPRGSTSNMGHVMS